jgi:hypothetical protein
LLIDSHNIMYTPQNLKIIDIFLRETVVADTLNMLHLLQQYREYREIDEYLDILSIEPYFGIVTLPKYDFIFGLNM